MKTPQPEKVKPCKYQIVVHCPDNLSLDETSAETFDQDQGDKNELVV